MWFESLYWKEELGRICSQITKKKNPPRYSERLGTTVEREVMVGFFLLRRLIELNKVSSRTSKQKLEVFGYAPVRGINRLNNHQLEENYNWEAESRFSKSVIFIANQFIHSYVYFSVRGKDRNWSDFIVASDFDRNRYVWRVPVEEIERVFKAAVSDYPQIHRMIYDEENADFKVETD